MMVNVRGNYSKRKVKLHGGCCSVMSYFLWLRGLKHTRLLCPSLSTRVCSNLCPLVMPSNYLILCCRFFLFPSIFPSIRFFSNESALHIKWPKYFTATETVSQNFRSFVQGHTLCSQDWNPEKSSFPSYLLKQYYRQNVCLSPRFICDGIWRWDLCLVIT